MERSMYQDNSFEQELKHKADEYRMYPSDNVWASIHHHFHSSSSNLNWKAAIAFFILFSSISLMVSDHQDKPYRFASTVSSQEEVPAFSRSENNSLAANDVSAQETNVPVKRTGEPLMVLYKKINPLADATASDTSPIPSIISLPDFQETESIVEPTLTPIDHSYKLVSSVPQLSISEPVQPSIIASGNNTNEKTEITPVLLNPELDSETDAAINYEVKVPVYIKTKPVKQLQIYVAPSASYRILYVDNKINWGNLRLDPESVVSHQSAIGWEAGVALLTPVSKRMNFKAGLQLNYTKYNVTASQTIPVITTVTLTSFTRIQRITTLRNSDGAIPKQLANETFQFSVPLGMEYRVAGNKQLSLNLAGTLQPSYTLTATGYLITTDYQNYIKAPDLLRRFNINTGIETYVKFNTGAIDIQAGPQLRYQLFSNSQGKYPIQEHLIDYGFKLGIIKKLK